MGHPAFRMFGVLKRLGVGGIRLTCLNNTPEYRLVLLVGIEGKMVLANEELWLAIVRLRVGTVYADKVEIRIHVSD